MKSLFITLLLIFAGSVAAAGQVTPPPGKTIVYVYSFNSEKTLGTIHKSMLLDDKVVADMTPGRYFILVIEPGVHTVSFKSKDWGGIEKDFAAGNVYYVRTGWKSGFTVRPTGVDLVGPESGSFDIKQLRPVEPGNIKDPKLAFRELP